MPLGREYTRHHERLAILKNVQRSHFAERGTPACPFLVESAMEDPSPLEDGPCCYEIIRFVHVPKSVLNSARMLQQQYPVSVWTQ